MTRRKLYALIGGVGSFWVAAVLVVFLVIMPKCQNKLGGQLTVDDKPFVPARCFSEQRVARVGVAIESADGRRIIVDQLDRGGAMVTVGHRDLSGTTELGTCAELAIDKTSVEINGIDNVLGRVTFTCRTDRGRSVLGTITFENCH
jgi:hypothetical protein